MTMLKLQWNKFSVFIRRHYYCKRLFNQITLLYFFRPDLDDQVLIRENMRKIIDDIIIGKRGKK